MHFLTNANFLSITGIVFHYITKIGFAFISSYANQIIFSSYYTCIAYLKFASKFESYVAKTNIRCTLAFFLWEFYHVKFTESFFNKKFEVTIRVFWHLKAIQLNHTQYSFLMLVLHAKMCNFRNGRLQLLYCVKW